MNPHIIRIGVVGHPSSGKDTIASYLVDTHKFVHISTGDLARFYIAEHGLGEPDRQLVHDVCNFLRAEHGPDYLVRLGLQNDATRLVLSGLRAVPEAETLQAEGGKIIAVSTSLERAYERAKERGRVGDHVSFAEFKRLADEEAQAAAENVTVQNVNAVIARADYHLQNEGSLEALHRKVDEVLHEIEAAR